MLTQPTMNAGHCSVLHEFSSNLLIYHDCADNMSLAEFTALKASTKQTSSVKVVGFLLDMKPMNFLCKKTKTNLCICLQSAFPR